MIKETPEAKVKGKPGEIFPLHLPRAARLGGGIKRQDPQEKIFPSFVHFLVVREETGSLLAHLHAFDLSFEGERGRLGKLKVLGDEGFQATSLPACPQQTSVSSRFVTGFCRIKKP